MRKRAGSTGRSPGTQAVTACSVEKALLARRRKRGSTMLSWEKIDAIPGWFMFQSYCVWRALLDQQARASGDLFEIGVWRGRSASGLASYRKGDGKPFLGVLRLAEEAVRRRLQQGLSLPAREPAALHGLHGLGHEPRAFDLWRQDHALQDDRPVGHRRGRHHRLCRRRRPDRRPRQRAAALAHDTHAPCLGCPAPPPEWL